MKRIRLLAIATLAAITLLGSSMAVADAPAGDDGQASAPRGGGGGSYLKR